MIAKPYVGMVVLVSGREDLAFPVPGIITHVKDSSVDVVIFRHGRSLLYLTEVSLNDISIPGPTVDNAQD